MEGLFSEFYGIGSSVIDKQLNSDQPYSVFAFQKSTEDLSPLCRLSRSN